MQFINTDQFYQEVGSRIRDARVSADMSQEILASQLDLTRASIINIEKGRHKPSLHLLLEIASILMVRYISLIPEKEPGHGDKAKAISLDLKKIVTDQPKMTKSTKETLQEFLHSIQK
jgi:DNA-binding XRE family transcriptional regulator